MIEIHLITIYRDWLKDIRKTVEVGLLLSVIRTGVQDDILYIIIWSLIDKFSLLKKLNESSKISMYNMLEYN